MRTATLTRRVYLVGEGLLLCGVLATAAWMSRSQEWQPALLALLLIPLALVGTQLEASVGGGRLTTAHIALVLCMTLLGPAPAVVTGLGVAVLISDPLRRKLPPALWLSNLFTDAAYPLTGALLARWALGDIHDPGRMHIFQSVEFAFVVFGVFLVTIAMNFLLIALELAVADGRSLVRQTREAFVPLLPGHLAAAVLAALLAVAYTNLGLWVLFGAVLVLLIFHYLTTALLRSEERADQLEARSIHLANLQFGVLSMLTDALALRDRSTSRHAAAVAHYAKALAEQLGCDEEDQEVIHTAALLHDIGKFAWSDRILHPQSLTDEDWEVIRRHPQEGSELVGKLDGYGPVADAILYHHERVDGGGYPAGLIGSEIPLASRIIALCSTFDTMTRGSSMGSPLTPVDAVAEMRGVAGRQLDAELVEAFVAMLESKGPLESASIEEPDYDSELAFKQRVRRMAEPSRR
jgi:putative nucleotidyltransferase with HDIG domain